MQLSQPILKEALKSDPKTHKRGRKDAKEKRRTGAKSGHVQRTCRSQISAIEDQCSVKETLGASGSSPEEFVQTGADTSDSELSIVSESRFAGLHEGWWGKKENA